MNHITQRLGNVSARAIHWTLPRRRAICFDERMIDFWFDFASPYSYVAAARVEAECAAAGVAFRYRPFLLGPLFSEQLGIKDSPFNVHPLRGRYMWRDVERLCEKYGLAFRRPSAFPRNGVLASRIACIDSPSTGAFVRRVFEANFASDRDISDPAVVEELAGGPALVAQAALPDVRGRVRANTDEARALGIFGAPDFTVAGELFFGQDRLGDALAWARKERR